MHNSPARAPSDSQDHGLDQIKTKLPGATYIVDFAELDLFREAEEPLLKFQTDLH